MVLFFVAESRRAVAGLAEESIPQGRGKVDQDNKCDLISSSPVTAACRSSAVVPRLDTI
jgi:hypothetical protein